MNESIWIDALDFDSYGGWKSDTQFTHLMGSAYLLACETPGVPVDDAKTQFEIKEAGMYRVWVRARNWFYTDAPGKFKVVVDEHNTDVVLGELPSNDWVWQIAGDYELANGMHDMSLVDLTGYFGRCSSIVVTNDMDYIPPRPVQAFEKERARLKGISLKPVEEASYDVVVAGAGPGGIPAAIAAARKGKKVLIITNRPVLGGNSSTECGVGFDGAAARQPHAREGGIVEEIIRIKGKYGYTWTKAIEVLCAKEDNITIVYNLHVCDVDAQENVIKSVTARHTINGTRHTYTGKIFIDCTGDGWLGYYAGAKYRIGREASWQFKEEFAPEDADLLTMSGCIMNVDFEDTGEPVEYTAPDWVPVMPAGKAFGRNVERVHQSWWNEAPNTLDDIYDAELARDEIQRVLLAYFNYLKNLWDQKERAANHVFKKMQYIDAKRESRRIIGDYILTQNDCVNQKIFDDVIGHTGWPIDIHHPKGMYSGEEGPFFSNTHVPLVQVPYRCIYSKNIENLFSAGRNISVSHIALGTTRVQSSIATMAQAAGTAAAMCIDKNMTPREIGQNHIKELQQQLLKDDQFLPGVKAEDPMDLSTSCEVSASSESSSEVFTWKIGYVEDIMPLDRQRATFFARGVSKEIPSLFLKIANMTDQDIPLTIHVREQKDPDGYVTEEDLKVVTQTIPANSEDWIEYPVDIVTELRYLWVKVDKVEGLGWRTWSCPPLDWTRSERTTDDEIFENIRWSTHMLSMEKPVEVPANCSPSNVINGYSRIMDPKNYCWVSDPKASLPQWIQLTYKEPTKVNEVHVTLDTDMNNMAMRSSELALPKTLVTDYDLELLEGGEWKVIGSVSDNCTRKHVYKFDTIRAHKLRLVVKDSGDHKSARVFEIRSYYNI